jgi:translation initiation factor 2 beta subunit (eIF-2beta)/eIF-5
MSCLLQLNLGADEDSCSEVKEDDGTESSRSNKAIAAVAAAKKKKKKNRKTVKKIKVISMKSSEDNLEEFEDEIDRSVYEVNKLLGKAAGSNANANKERDSPIVKHYPQIKNPCFVSCVNSALCS